MSKYSESREKFRDAGGDAAHHPAKASRETRTNAQEKSDTAVSRVRERNRQIWKDALHDDPALLRGNVPAILDISTTGRRKSLIEDSGWDTHFSYSDEFFFRPVEALVENLIERGMTVNEFYTL